MIGKFLKDRVCCLDPLLVLLGLVEFLDEKSKISTPILNISRLPRQFSYHDSLEDRTFLRRKRLPWRCTHFRFDTNRLATSDSSTVLNRRCDCDRANSYRLQICYVKIRSRTTHTAEIAFHTSTLRLSYCVRARVHEIGPKKCWSRYGFDEMPDTLRIVFVLDSCWR
jgi:hypothetical protein